LREARAPTPALQAGRTFINLYAALH